MNQLEKRRPGQFIFRIADHLYCFGVWKFNDLILGNEDGIVGIFHQQAIFFLTLLQGTFRPFPVFYLYF